MPRAALLILFFLTGATALGYQLVWTRMFANGFGHEMSAVLAVVGAFMGGMALGARTLGGVIWRSAHPGRWYAALEMLVGVWAALSCLLIPVANRMVYSEGWLVDFGLAFLALLPATMAMGASFPAMARLLTDRSIGAVYASNTLGAMTGILVVVWWLMPAVGLRASALTLAGINLGVGLAAWFILRASPSAKAEPGLPITRRHFITICVTGLLAIGYEILGVRILAQVMENTVYSLA